MYAHFYGKIDSILKDKVIIDVNNIGYEIYMPESEISRLEIGEQLKIYTHLNVRGLGFRDIRLYETTHMILDGIVDLKEIEKMPTVEARDELLKLSGVGPKVALGIISNISTSDMCIAIATEDVALLKQIPGIGPKMAQKIIFELKDKITNEDLISTSSKSGTSKFTNSNEQEAITALQVLGYSLKQIKDVLSKVDISNCSVEEIIKKVLKEMQNI